jgi:hypothetical protein
MGGACRDKQKQREYQREWARRKRAGLPTAWKNQKILTPVERKEYQLNYSREYKRRHRELAAKIFGENCLFCGAGTTKDGRSNALHEKHGNPHLDTDTAGLAIRNPENWVRLRYRCHNAVHWCMKYFGMSWEEIRNKAIIG